MNIYDIAREAGVSIATVSRVLNHKDTVRADTRAKVEKVLKRCNYAPSAIAQGMVSKSLHTVAVLTVDIRDSHYARTAYTIEREFGRRGYEVILCNTGGDRAETLRTLQAVAQKQVDGLILVGSIFNTICQGAEMENLLRKMPVVLANGTLALPDAYSVMVDDCRGVEMAVEHLVKTGRRNLYYIKDKSTDSAAAKAKGFLSGMAAAGLDADGHVLETGETLEDGIRAVQQLFRSVFHFERSFLPDGSQFDHLFQDGETFHVGGLELTALHVPGHTPADMAYRVGDDVFVGDTLFMPDVGTARADFPGGDAATLYRSIQRLLALPAHTRLHMCHDYPPENRAPAWVSTVAEQRSGNIHVHEGVTEAAFVQMRTARDATLAMPTLILPSVQVNVRAGKLPPAQDDGRTYIQLPINAFLKGAGAPQGMT